MRVSMLAASMCRWKSDRLMPESGLMVNGKACHPVMRSASCVGTRKTSARWPKCADRSSKFLLRRSRFCASFKNCTSPKEAEISLGSKFHPTSSKMKMSSYSIPSTSEKILVVPRADPKSLGSLRRPHRRNVRHRSTQVGSSRTTIPPVPAAVMIGDRPDLVPVRTIADQVWDEHGLGLGPDSALYLADVDLEGVELDVDIHWDQAPSDQWSDVSGEGHRRSHHLAAFVEVQQLDRQLERRGARVAHHAALFTEEI